MNSEKSYDSLPNFTAADCEYPVAKECVFVYASCLLGNTKN